MKKIFLLLVSGLVLFSAFSTYKPDPGIIGIVEPADAVTKVSAVKENDSVSAVPVNGRFSLVLKPGNWSLVVEAINPYKNHVQTVLVLEGGPTDVGVIKLMK